MTNEKKNLYCKNQIAGSFVELLKDRKIQTVSITEIVEKAQVSRITFYRNFKDKEDILRYYIVRETDKWLSQTEDNYITLTNIHLTVRGISQKQNGKIMLTVNGLIVTTIQKPLSVIMMGCLSFATISNHFEQDT